MVTMEDILEYNKFLTLARTWKNAHVQMERGEKNVDDYFMDCKVDDIIPDEEKIRKLIREVDRWDAVRLEYERKMLEFLD